MRTLSLDLRGRAAGETLQERTSARGAGASILVHGIGIGALILIPLLSPIVSPDAARSAQDVLMSPIIVTAPPPPAGGSGRKNPGPPRPHQAPALVVVDTPTALPSTNASDVLDATLDISPGTTVGDASPGDGTGNGPGGDCVIGAMCGTTVPQVEPDRETVRIGGHIKEPQLLDSRPPVFPDIARAAGLSAVVIMETHVDSNGLVENVKVLRGHPVFDDAAVASARSRRYRPLLLNGERTEFILTITVVFNLRR